MGGCFRLPGPATRDPDNGQPRQPGAASMARSLCQSIRDFFMKCLFSRWCMGGFGDSMVQTSLNIPPTVSEPEHAEEDPTRNPGDKQREPELTGAKSRHGADGSVVPGRNEIPSIQTHNPGNLMSDPSLRKKLTKCAVFFYLAKVLMRMESASNPNVRTGVDGNEVAGTGAEGNEIAGTGADGSVVARTGTDDSAVLRKDKGPSVSN